MESILPIIAWLQANMMELSAVLVSAIALAEAVTRLTPTTTDDGFVKRMGFWVDKLLSWLPNNVKK